MVHERGVEHMDIKADDVTLETYCKPLSLVLCASVGTLSSDGREPCVHAPALNQTCAATLIKNTAASPSVYLTAFACSTRIIGIVAHSAALPAAEPRSPTSEGRYSAWPLR